MIALKTLRRFSQLGCLLALVGLFRSGFGVGFREVKKRRKEEKKEREKGEERRKEREK